MQLLDPTQDYNQQPFILPLMEPYYYNAEQRVDDLQRYGICLTDCLLVAISEAGQLDELAVYDALYATAMAYIHGDDYATDFADEYHPKPPASDLDAFLCRNLTLVWQHYGRYIDFITAPKYGKLAYVDDVREIGDSIGLTAFYHRH